MPSAPVSGPCSVCSRRHRRTASRSPRRSPPTARSAGSGRCDDRSSTAHSTFSASSAISGRSAPNEARRDHAEPQANAPQAADPNPPDLNEPLDVRRNDPEPGERGRHDPVTDVDHSDPLLVADGREVPASPAEGTRHDPRPGRHRSPRQRCHPAARDEQSARPHRAGLGAHRPTPPRRKDDARPRTRGCARDRHSARPRRRPRAARTSRLADTALRQLSANAQR